MEVALEGLRFHAKHGVHDHERQFGGNYVVNVYLTLRPDVADQAGRTDSLKQTVNYAELARIVGEQMAQPRYLIESLAHHIAQRLWIATEAKINQLRVRVEKHDPPGLPGTIAWVEAVLPIL